MSKLEMKQIIGREILDSRGNPTVEAEVILKDGSTGVGMAPSGASTGEHEALELRDQEKSRYFGQGVQKAVSHINTVIAKELKGHRADDIYGIDNRMRCLDGTPDKSRLGANAMLAVSIAATKAAAKAKDLTLCEFLGGISGNHLPVPMMNILNGGRHAENTVDFQEFMIMPAGAGSFREALRMGAEVYQALKEILKAEKKSTAVGDEGGFAPDIKGADEVFSYLVKAVDKAGYQTGKDIVFAMDAAASELYDKKSGKYVFAGEGCSRTTEEMIEYYKKMCEKYPLVSIEDGLDENDWDGWKKMTQELGKKVQLVGDDLFVTNTKRLQKGIDRGCANSILIKLNQIGTVSETIEAIKLAKKAGYTAVVSHRSGETEDTTIADFAVALNCGQIKTGAPCRSERVAKYNRLLRLEDRLGDSAIYAGKSVIKNMDGDVL